MDKSTTAFIKTISETPDPTAKILGIYGKYKSYDKTPLTVDVVTHIFSDVIKTFYNGLDSYLQTHPKKRLPIKITDTKKTCAEADSLLEAKAYDDTDPEFAIYDYGLDTPIACINTLDGQKILYSGGYITKSRVIFVILMLLHETVHLIEYKDPYITTSEASHTVFFYKIGNKAFGLLSRLSEIIESPDQLVFTPEERILDLKKLKNKNNLSDGISILDDYSHYTNNSGKNVLKGYITYSKFKTPSGLTFIESMKPSGGQRKTRRARKAVRQ